MIVSPVKSPPRTPRFINASYAMPALDLMPVSCPLPSSFFSVVRRHHHPAFQIAHGILRDEVAAEKITQQVFARARRRLERGADSSSVVCWIYHASLRFSCRYYWKSASPSMRRRLAETWRCRQTEFALLDFVRVLALHPGKIEQHDCEMIALRHVIGLSPVQIGQLLRMHPYEISNRVTWSLERLKEIRPAVFSVPAADEFVQPASA